MNNSVKQEILDFLEWATENSYDAFEIFEKPEELLEKYIKEQKE